MYEKVTPRKVLNTLAKAEIPFDYIIGGKVANGFEMTIWTSAPATKFKSPLLNRFSFKSIKQRGQNFVLTF